MIVLDNMPAFGVAVAADRAARLAHDAARLALQVLLLDAAPGAEVSDVLAVSHAVREASEGRTVVRSCEECPMLATEAGLMRCKHPLEVFEGAADFARCPMIAGPVTIGRKR